MYIRLYSLVTIIRERLPIEHSFVHGQVKTSFEYSRFADVEPLFSCSYEDLTSCANLRQKVVSQWRLKR